MTRAQASLFAAELPPGFRHREDLIMRDQEAALLDGVAQVAFSHFEMRGAVARRRVAFFGGSYDAAGAASPPIPPFLQPLRETLGDWTGIDPSAFAMALINEYPPGAPIGWHRDAPQYDVVAGVSLLSPCRMRFRPYLSPAELAKTPPPRRTFTHEIVLNPRSAYLMAGEARTSYEHHIPAVTELRYSITFRTLRR